MAELIASIVLLVSFGGLVYIIGRKVPVLLEFSSQDKKVALQGLALRLKGKMKESPALKRFASPELLLHTALSKGRIATLKTERKMGTWLEDLRKKAQEKNTKKFADSYWDKLKKKDDTKKRPKVT